ncbi:MAG: protease, amino terminal family [Caulobacter sp.]|nr:protease, amino terminal family [Caulobacter sp.]
MTPVLLLALIVGLLVFSGTRDRKAFAKFKALTETRDRQHAFLRWAAGGFILFGAPSLLSLAALARWGAILEMPEEIQAFRHLVGMGRAETVLGPAYGVVMLLALAAATGLRVLLARRRAARSGPRWIAGDVLAMFPRNNAERAAVTLLSLGAGFNEELLFRLVLPLLIVLVTGQPVLGIVLATLAFGLLHLYQGWRGVLVTTVVGAVMTAFYLATGQLWQVMLLHAAMNINSLVIGSWLRPVSDEP